MKKEKGINNKTIDNVTTKFLELACRMAGIYLSLKEVDIIIDIVELLEEKSGEVTLRDITSLIEIHNNLEKWK